MMKKLTPIIAIYLLLTGSVIAQNFNINFQAFGETNNIDSVFVKNLSSETELRLAGSDILHLLPASSLRRVSGEFALAGLYPNPTEFECDIDFIITKPAFTTIEIADVGGKILVQHKEFLNDAYYRFTLSGIGSGVYVLNIRSDSFLYQTKIVGTGHNTQLSLQKTTVAENYQHQTTDATTHYTGKSTIDMLYAYGDILLFEAVSDGYHRTIATLKLTADDETVTDHTVYFGFYTCLDAGHYMYSIVKIGGHFWMAEDLNTLLFRDSSTIENIPESTAWAASSQPASCNYNNTPSGQALYNWYAATDSRSLCPQGWHLPADFEWQRLEEYMGMSADEQNDYGWRGDGTAALLKESGIQNWLSQSGTDINLSGFSARPAGMRNFAGLFFYSGKNAVWWTATENRDNTAWCRALQFDSNAVYRKDGLKNMGLAVRCIKNYPPEVITGPVNETTDTSVVVSVKLLNNGGAEVTEKGVVWSQNPVPLLETNEGAVSYDGDNEIFELSLPGLTAGSEYYYRAYAVNEVGVGYGSIETFSTSGLPVTLPVVVTIEVIDITHNSAGSGGNVISDGGAPVTARGVVWAPFSNPSLEFNQGYTTDGSGTGEFFSSITGLGQSTSFYVCAYATNSAGTSYGQMLNFTTTTPAFVCGDNVTFIYNGSEVTYGTVESNGRCWLDRNLGALDVAEFSSDSTAYGDLFQWGRGADGHQLIQWYSTTTGNPVNGTTSSLSTSDSPGHSDFILAPDAPNDWISPQNDNLWQGVDGINNPCPSGWRVPTEAEWNIELLSWGTNNSAGAFASPLKLPVAGGRYSDGSLNDVGSFGRYWSSTVSGAGTIDLSFDSSGAGVDSYYRADGRSVRCIKDEETQATLPTLSTDPVTNITETTATCGGNITDAGGSYIDLRGVVWSSSPNPSFTNNEGYTDDGAAGGAFVSEITGLSPGTTYYVRAFATNETGTAYGQEESFATPVSFVCGDNVTFIYNGSEVTYGTVESNGRCWLDRNLGALDVAEFSSDSTAYGDLFQWGRAADGHQLIDWSLPGGTPISGTTNMHSASETPVHSDFILAPDSPNDWISPQNDNLWQGVNGVNNPCPSGWRVPTEAEWTTEFNSWSILNADGAFESTLKLTVANSRSYSDGWFYDAPGSSGHYWSSDLGGTGSISLTFYSLFSSFESGGRASGLSVRCIKDEESQATLPSISTGAVTEISQTTAICGGNIFNDGGAAIIVRGVVWSTSPAPSFTNYEGFTEDGASTGEFVSEISGLNPASTYYVRAYATNSTGTAYGDENNFFTIDCQQYSVEVSGSQETVCENNSIILDCICDGVAPFEYSWSGPDGFLSNEQSPELNNVKFYQSGYYVVIITDINGCIIKDSVLINIMESIHQISYPDVVCDGLNEFYSVEFEVTNVLGTPMQFIVNGLLQSEVYSTSNQSAGTFSAVVSDINVCSEYSLDYFHDCDCMTFAGTFTGIETLVLQIAECVPSELHNSDQILDVDDIFEFFVHNGSLIPLYYSNTLNICFGDIPGAMLNVEYYIVGVAGNDAMGHVDVNDPCRHVTFSIPVIWTE